VVDEPTLRREALAECFVVRRVGVELRNLVSPGRCLRLHVEELDQSVVDGNHTPRWLDLCGCDGKLLDNRPVPLEARSLFACGYLGEHEREAVVVRGDPDLVPPTRRLVVVVVPGCLLCPQCSLDVGSVERRSGFRDVPGELPAEVGSRGAEQFLGGVVEIRDVKPGVEGDDRVRNPREGLPIDGLLARIVALIHTGIWCATGLNGAPNQYPTAGRRSTGMSDRRHRSGEGDREPTEIPARIYEAK